MLLNHLLTHIQNRLTHLYNRSCVLQNLDGLIFVNIILVLITTTFASSDLISYFAIFTIILTFIKIFTKPKELFKLSLSDLFLLLYFFCIAISVAGSSLLLLSIKGFSKTLIYFGFYISFIHYLKDNRNKLKYILITIAALALTESFIALKQNFLSVAEISGWQDVSRLNSEQIMTRVYGTLKPFNPNLFGGYLLSVLPTSLILIFLPLINNHKKTSLYGALSILLISIAIILTGCRGAYIGLFFELLLTAALTYRFLKPIYKKIFLKFSAVITSISCFLILTSASLKARILSIFAMRSDSSNSFRFNVYNSCMEMFKDNWILGIGVGNQNFREIYGLYMKTGFDALSAYNIYLETAVESGFFALVTFMLFISINLYNACKYIFRKNNSASIYLAIAVISIIGILIHGLVDTVFYRPQIQFMFWIMIGIIRVYTSSWGKYGYKTNY